MEQCKCVYVILCVCFCAKKNASLIFYSVLASVVLVFGSVQYAVLMVHFLLNVLRTVDSETTFPLLMSPVILRTAHQVKCCYDDVIIVHASCVCS